MTDVILQIARFLKENRESVIAIFTVVLAISTVALWASTRIAARAAQKAAVIAEQSLVRLERAFVFVKEISVFVEREAETMGAYGPIQGRAVNYRLSVTFENSGRTPAIRMRYNFNCGYIVKENLNQFDFRDQGDARKGIIGPTATLQTFHRNLSPANVDQIARKIDRWFI